MNPGHMLIVTCLLLLAHTRASKGVNVDDWAGYNDANHEDGAIFIDDERPQDDDDDYYDGSGYDEGYDHRRYPQNDNDFPRGREDDESASGDDNEEGSGAYWADQHSCVSLKKQVEDKGLLGVDIPSCTEDGGFERMQCSGTTGDCWCVDNAGREIKGTRGRGMQPDCDRIVIDPPVERPGNKAKPNRDGEVIDLPGLKDNDYSDQNIEIEPTDRDQTSTELKNSIDNMAEGEPGVEIDTVPPETNQIEMMESKGDQQFSSAAVMTQPGILAGIVGGTLVGLLCAVLLVMFIVYRMRKKDEGSYALDEPKRSPSLHTYSRAPTKEFYA